MLFNQDSFRSYESRVLDTLDFNNFKPGTYGLNLTQLREIDGLGAKVLCNLATLLQIPENVNLLKFGMDADYKCTFCMYPSWRVLEDEGNSDLYFVMGDFKATLTQVFEAVSESFAFSPEILTVGTEQDKREIACFTFTKSGVTIVRDTDKFSFVVKPVRAIETAADQLVDIFANSNGMQDLYQSLLSCGIVAGLGEDMNFCHLKELPFGAYEVSNLFWEDKTVLAKQGANAGKEVRITNWKFTATSMLDGTKYGVDASKGSFFGKAIAADSAYLNTASKESGGTIYMMIEGHRELAQGTSVEGRLILRQAIAQKMLEAQQNRALAAANGSVAPKALPQTVTVPSAPVKSAAPVTVDVSATLDADIPF